MRDNELLAEWVNELAHDLRVQIGEMSPAALYWQPDAEANSIGITVWHIARWFDVLTVRVIHNRLPEDEQWHTRGWYEKTGYDPRGVGYRGLGAITGYSLAQVKRVPEMSANDLLAYLDQVCFALRDSLLTLNDGAVHQLAHPNAKRTLYENIKPIVKGALGHVGEIQALIEMQRRQV